MIAVYGMLVGAALASDWTLDAQATAGARAGGVAFAEHTLWRGVVFSGGVSGAADQHWLTTRAEQFERTQTVRFALLPGVGLRGRTGVRRRTDWFATWHAGPELLTVREQVVVREPNLGAVQWRTEVVAVSALRLGVRRRWSERFGVVASILVPTLSSLGGDRLEPVHLGLGITWRPQARRLALR